MNWVDWSMVWIGLIALVVELVAVAGRRWFGKDWWTISKVMRQRGRYWLIWPHGWAVLGGHWFHDLWWEWFPWLPPHQPWMTWALVADLSAVVARDLLNRRSPKPVSKRAMAIMFLIGLPVGAVLWAQG